MRLYHATTHANLASGLDPAYGRQPAYNTRSIYLAAELTHAAGYLDRSNAGVIFSVSSDDPIRLDRESVMKTLARSTIDWYRHVGGLMCGTSAMCRWTPDADIGAFQRRPKCMLTSTSCCYTGCVLAAPNDCQG